MKRIYFTLLILQASSSLGLELPSFETMQTNRMVKCAEYEREISDATGQLDIDDILDQCTSIDGFDEACKMLAEDCGY